MRRDDRPPISYLQRSTADDAKEAEQPEKRGDSGEEADGRDYQALRLIDGS